MSLVSKERSSASATIHFFPEESFFPSIQWRIKDPVVTATQWFLNWVFHLHRTRWESHLKENKFKTKCSFRTNCPSNLKVEFFEILLLLLPHQVLSNSSQRTPVFKVEIPVTKWHLTVHSELYSPWHNSSIYNCIFSTLFMWENMWGTWKFYMYFWNSQGETEQRLVCQRMSEGAWSLKGIRGNCYRSTRE